MADTQQFANVDLAKWTRIQSQVKAKTGISITSDIGDSSAKGIEISWSYNSQTQDLAVSLVKRSWFDPAAAEIDTDIKTWIEAA